MVLPPFAGGMLGTPGKPGCVLGPGCWRNTMVAENDELGDKAARERPSKREFSQPVRARNSLDPAIGVNFDGPRASFRRCVLVTILAIRRHFGQGGTDSVSKRPAAVLLGPAFFQSGLIPP